MHNFFSGRYRAGYHEQVKKILLIISAIVIVCALGYGGYIGYGFYRAYGGVNGIRSLFTQSMHPLAAPVLEKYGNSTYGFRFAYTNEYALTEGDIGTSTGSYHEIKLTAISETVPAVDGEAPPSIRIDIYKNTVPPMTMDDWFKKVPEQSGSNLTDGTYNSVSASDSSKQPVITYHRTGLYEGDTTAFVQRGYIIALSVTYRTPHDAIVSAYNTMLASFHIDPTPK